MRLIALIERWPRSLSVIVGAVSIVLIGMLDFLTGYQLSFSAFYLLPIFVLSWQAGRWGGLGGAAGSAAARTLADLLAGHVYSSPLYPVWNAVMRLLLFGVVGLIISALKKHFDQERSLARIDHLTGAANTRSFMEILKAEAERSRRYNRLFTIAYFDLDNFKAVNDKLGHAAGDEVLKAVVSHIRAHVRATDVVARLGGDEFALLLPETDEPAARIAMAKIQSRIKAEMEAKSLAVTVSIGSLTCSGAEVEVEDLVKRADNLMYAAKEKGKNRAEYAEESRAPRQ
jgi:diguanylate cyclase (GGDEF)-like protein